MRKTIIAGNWKMNMTPDETHEFFKQIVDKIPAETDKVALICVPFTSLAVCEKYSNQNVKIGAQNVFYEDSGAYTGEISASMLKNSGVSYVIVGHSERRKYFAETDEIVCKKALQVIKYGMRPIVCVGETLEEREKNETFKRIQTQIQNSLKGFTEDDASKTVIAYEPIWAIGTGKTATASQAEEVCAFIRDELHQMFKDTAYKMTIQYGGSVKPENIKEFMKKDNIDGALVGGASLKADSFVELVTYDKK